MWSIVTLVLLHSVTSQGEEGDAVSELTSRLDVLTEMVKGLDRQLTLSQLYLDEQTRVQGNSGIKQQRVRSSGTRPYYSESFGGQFYADFHDHPNFVATVGVGEFVAVLNGVQFRTRHNDYDLVQPSLSSKDYHAVDRIPFPDVPPEVLEKNTVEEQVKEMREWFRAWIQQDVTIRNYTDYFKAVIAYVEGAWTFTESEVDEPFFSTRHKIEAKTWFDLQEEVRFLGYAGSKHSSENNAFLPSVIYNYTTDGRPIYAQWNYRILCHPLSFSLPLNRFHVVDDLKSRIQTNMAIEDYKISTRARFMLNPEDTDYFEHGGVFNELLDKIMREIPGKDNYPGYLEDDGIDGIAVDEENNIINTAFYHHKFGLRKKGSSGAIRSIRERGFSDPTLYMAMTSNSKVVPMRDARCKKDKCGQAEQRWTYAIPLEIVYLTPLNKWNPCNIEYKGDADSPEGQTVSDQGQTGSYDKPFDGVNSEKYFLMPHEFFFGKKESDGNGIKGAVYVKNKAGEKCPTASSGIRVLSPSMQELGRVRFRYPIGPIHEEGSVAWKEMEALKDMYLQPQKYGHLLYEPLTTAGPGSNDQVGNMPSAPTGDVVLETRLSAYEGFQEHTHSVTLTRRQVDRLKKKLTITKESTNNFEHTHKFKLKYKEVPSASDDCDMDSDVIIFETCDGTPECWDNHPKCFNVKEGRI